MEKVEESRKAEKLQYANAQFEYANNTAQYLEVHKIYKEIF